MASAQPTLKPSDMECPVCHEHFSQPKILPCAHVICRDCLVTWLRSNPQAQCRLCRCAIVKPGRVSAEEVADGLPTDLAMAAVVDSAKILRDKHTCQACLNLPADTICLYCGDFFCTACATLHVRMSATRHHATADLSTLTAERLAASRPALCSAHNDKVCELYCPTHGASICHACATVKHRACPEVKELEEKVKEARDVLGELAAMLKSGESELERAMRQLDQEFAESEKSAKQALADIDAACERLQHALHACRQRLKQLVLDAQADIARVVKDAKNLLVARRGKLTSHRRVVERTETTSAQVGLIDMSVTLKALVSGLNLTSVLPKKTKVITKATLTMEPQALARIEKELSELGQISRVPVSVCAPKQASVAQSSVPPQAQSPPQPVVLRFHTNHGESVRLSNGRQTARRTGPRGSGLVVSSEPMVVNRLYEVRLDQFDTWISPSRRISTGVLTADPDTCQCSQVWCSFDLTSDFINWDTTVKALGSEVRLDQFDTWISPSSRRISTGVLTADPDTRRCSQVWCSFDLTSDFIIWDTAVKALGSETLSTVGAALTSVRVGDRVGVAVTDDRCLHLYVNGQDQGVATRNVTQPCYAFWDLYLYWKRVTALPVSVIRQ